MFHFINILLMHIIILGSNQVDKTIY